MRGVGTFSICSTYYVINLVKLKLYDINILIYLVIEILAFLEVITCWLRGVSQACIYPDLLLDKRRDYFYLLCKIKVILFIYTYFTFAFKNYLRVSVRLNLGLNVNVTVTNQLGYPENIPSHPHRYTKFGWNCPRRSRVMLEHT